MKKFMIRKKPYNKFVVINNHLPKSFKYGVWYDFVTPFDWQYFKLVKGSRYVSVYDFIDSKTPAYTVTRKRFINEILVWAKSEPNEVE